MKKIFTVFAALLITATLFAQRSATLTREEQLNKKYTSGLFSTSDGTYFDLEGDNTAFSAASYLNILDWLQGRVAGLQIYSYYGNRIPFIRNSPASVFVNEMRVDAAFLNMLPVADIAMIKIIKTPFVGVWGGAGGAIAIYTKDGGDPEE